MKVISVVGARPQFIKAFAVSRELRPDHEEILVHTGQHYDEEMSDVFFEELGMPEPDYNLGVGSDSHGRQTAAMLEGIEEVTEVENPDALLLYGDTNSTLAGAIAGSKMDPAVAHVEAGLRSYNREMPEETNRVLTDHASDILFAPSESAVETLAEEGIADGVHFVGDVMYDAILWARDVTRESSTILGDLPVEDEEYVLATVHRASNTNDRSRLEAIIDGLAATPYQVVIPLHPRTRERLEKYGLWERASTELILIDPVGYIDFVRLLDGAAKVATDSGGVQKEAFYLDTPCVTMRDETEWRETIECGWNELVGTDESAIVEALQDGEVPPSKPKVYGCGNAAVWIVGKLEDITVNR